MASLNPWLLFTSPGSEALITVTVWDNPWLFASSVYGLFLMGLAFSLGHLIWERPKIKFSPLSLRPDRMVWFYIRVSPVLQAARPLGSACLRFSNIKVSTVLRMSMAWLNFNVIIIYLRVRSIVQYWDFPDTDQPDLWMPDVRVTSICERAYWNTGFSHMILIWPKAGVSRWGWPRDGEGD